MHKVLTIGAIFLSLFSFFLHPKKPAVPTVATTTTVSQEVSQIASTTPKTKPALVACAVNSTNFPCYQNYYTELVAEKGVPAAFTDLKAKYATSPYVQSQCHPLTHIIGRAATDLYPTVSEAFAHGDSYCWSGYYHGVMEGAVKKMGLGNVSTKLDTVCNGIPGKTTYSFDYYNCVHGLGHGLMDVTNDNLFTSLKLCDNLTGSWEESSCYGGVFMENVITDGITGSSEYLKPSDPLYPCDAVDAKYKSSCYLMQTSYALTTVNSDFKKVFDICATADAGYQDICWQSLGRDASGRSVSNADQTKTTCMLGSNYEQQSNCIIGAVKDFISYYHSDTQAKHLCSILDPTLTQICTDTATAYYKSL